MSTYITTSYRGPDLDGYSCAIAYAELLRAQGKDAVASFWGDVHVEVQWLIETFDLITPPTLSFVSGDEQVVLLDASSPEDVPEALHPDQVIEIIDHRRIHHAAEFLHATAQIELVGAAATLVAERFRDAGIIPTKESALLLYGGILSNTQNFTAIATDRDRDMATWLCGLADAPADLADRMFLAKSDLGGEKLSKTLLGDSKVLVLNNHRVAIAQLEVIDAHTVIESRRPEIENVLQTLHDDAQSDYTFANIKDLKLGVSFLLCLDEATQTLLASVPDTTWNGQLGFSKTLTLRKQLSAWIDERLK